ncbi:SNF1-interacting protein [Stygiomarasmius scandens]|uniref:SNF1-interacting protein n=1 Tax=Marasmiellus scandens TaxID=2682957 RepID=A0ABR1JST1_9AGAR
MGNSSSSSSRPHNDETVDFGYLTPQGVYTGPRDWNHAIVTQLICSRRLAPFYRPLEDYDDSWTDDQILAARRNPPEVEQSDSTRAEASQALPASASSKSHTKRPSTLKDPAKPEAAIYRGAVECPICFLYYPPNINHSRCCDQAICTECFVQIKRSEPTTTHLVSEPAACPYCVQENFGIVYTPPPWRAGIGSEGSNSHWLDSHKGSSSIETSVPSAPTHKRRQKSFGADSPEVVTTDHIRPDWEAKLAAVRAAVTRRANRRIIMRQVGDRLIPVGVTSGRVHALTGEEGGSEGAENGGSSRRSRRRQQAPNGPFEQYLGQDLEELMVMEAMRLSLLEHEEQQRKEAEEKKKKEKEAAAKSDSSAESGAGPSTDSSNVEASSSSSTPQNRSFLNIRRASKSRSPSPAARPTGNDHQADAPPFSTLNAALSTSSTASAILNSSISGVGENTSVPGAPESVSQPAAAAGAEAAESQSQPRESQEASPETSASRPEAVHTDTSVSVLSTDSTVVASDLTYDHLPSSEENSAQEPLIPKKPNNATTSEDGGEPPNHVGNHTTA